ncbi:response regulator transcription factor [Cryobacterium sp. PAMC25264]|uniref:response regulator transcription factor n=1 Tax=Cryobacterium sp. PAMC25264 TaxID=2861288 RepID=UPI001C625C9D|nr:response regulator transcription factor [Cryobacterium sp. PAMC25264]QYF73252.1 response regulator transcription factor [Cryobacterium sp. PAMC25264]
MISVVLADDQTLIRTAVAELVSHEDGFTVAGQAANGREAVDLVRETRPDIVLMDIRIPVMDGIQATAAICADPLLAATRIIVLTTFEEDEYVLQALRAGASGFVGKGTEAPDLMNAIRTVHGGDALLSPRATKALIDRYTAPDAPTALVVPAALASLTEREREILLLVGSGHANGDIAAELVISPHTAKTHVNRMMTKLGAHDRAQLVIIAYESGLLVPGAQA